VHFFEGYALALHLLVDGVNVFGTSADLGFDAFVAQHLLEAFHNPLDGPFPFRAPLRQFLGNHPVHAGVHIAKGQIFQLVPDALHAQPVGQGGKDVQASLMGTTRMSSHMARKVLRRFS